MTSNQTLLSPRGVIARLDGRTEADSDSARVGACITLRTLGPGDAPTYMLHGSVEDLIALCSTACVGAPNSFPVSAQAHLFDEVAFSQAPNSDSRHATSVTAARLAAYLSIGELFVYLNEGRPAPPSAYASQYTRTLAFALSRSYLLWPKEVNIGVIYSRWKEVRELTGWQANASLLPDRLFKDLSYWICGSNEFSWADPLRSDVPLKGTADFGLKAGELVARKFALQLVPMPASFDARFEWLSSTADSLSNSTATSDDVGFALGLLLASVEPGELMHLNWLRNHLTKFPHAAVHYSGWSATLSEHRRVRTDVFGGLGRRLMRDLLRPFHTEDAPMEDVSWLDLKGAGSLLDDVRLRASGRNLNISLVPGVVIGGALHKAQTPAAELTKTVKSSTTRVAKTGTQPMLFDSLPSDASVARLKRELLELSERVDALQNRKSVRTTTKSKRK